jgi:hypothetical protein
MVAVPNALSAPPRLLYVGARQGLKSIHATRRGIAVSQGNILFNDQNHIY